MIEIKKGESISGRKSQKNTATQRVNIQSGIGVTTGRNIRKAAITPSSASNNLLNLSKNALEQSRLKTVIPSKTYDAGYAEEMRLKKEMEKAKDDYEAIKKLDNRTFLEKALDNIGGVPNSLTDAKLKYEAKESEYKTFKNQMKRVREAVNLASVAYEGSGNYDYQFNEYAKKGETLGNKKSWTEHTKNMVAYWRNNPKKLKSWETAKDLFNGAVGESILNNLITYLAAKYMTDDEFAIYNYYLAREEDGIAEKGIADRYLKSIQDVLTDRQAADISGDKGLLGKYAYAYKAGVDQWVQGAINRFDFKDGYIPQTGTQKASAQIRSDIKEQNGFIGGMVYDTINTTANMMPSILASVAANAVIPGSGGIVGGLLTGVSASGNAYQEMLNLGYSKSQANVYSALVGASEVALSATVSKVFGGGKLNAKITNAIDKIDNGIARFAANYGHAFVSEGLEEGAQDILAPLFENIALGYNKNGFDDIDWSEAAYSALLGGLSGGNFEIAGAIAKGKTEYQKAKTNKNVLSLVENVKNGRFKANDKVYLDNVTPETASKIQELTGIDVTDYKVAIEARQIEHILKDHGAEGKTDRSMADDNDIAKIEYVLSNPDSIINSGTTKAYVSNIEGKNKPAKTVLYEKDLGENSYYAVQAVPDTSKKTLYIVSAFIGESGYKKETSQLTDANSPSATPESGSATVSNEALQTADAISPDATPESETVNTSSDISISQGNTAVNNNISRSDGNYDENGADISAISQNKNGSGITELDISEEKVDWLQKIGDGLVGYNRMTDGQKALLKAAQNLGWKIGFSKVYAKDKNGSVVIENGLVKRADSRVDKAKKEIVFDYNCKNPIRELLKHELTHFLELDIFAHQDFINKITSSNVFKTWIRRKGFNSAKEYNLHIREIYNGTKGFENSDVAQLSADCEMAAQFVAEKLFNNEQSSLEKVLNEMNSKEKKSFKEVISRFFEKIKAAFKGTTQATEIAQLEKMWIQTYKKAEAAFEKQVENEKNLDNNGVKYCVREIGANAFNPNNKSLNEQLNDAYKTSNSFEQRYVYVGEFSKSFIELLKNNQIILHSYPIAMNYRDAYLSMHSKETGKYHGKGINYHSLGVAGLQEALESFKNPEHIIKSKKEGKIELALQTTDKKGNDILAIVAINTVTLNGNKMLDAHIVTSAYGKRNIENYISAAKSEGRLIEYKNKEISQGTPQVQYEGSINETSSKDIILNEEDIVNTNSMQQSEKNAGQYSIGSPINIKADNNNSMRNDEEYSIPSEAIDRKSVLTRLSNGEITVEEADGLLRKEKIQNPLEIASMQEGDAFTTPPLKRKAGEASGDGKSKFYGSIQESKLFDESFKEEAALDTHIEFYKTVTNKETLRTAAKELDEGGWNYVEKWWSIKPERASLIDTTVGFLLMDRYQRIGDIDSAVAVAEKTREFGTAGGQQIQIFSIIGRFSPEMMAVYAQKELSRAFEKMAEKRTQKWIDENGEKFNLTEEDIEFIRTRTLQAAVLPEGSREKAIRLAEICTLLQDKMPPQRGQGIRAYQRISMLLNIKTNIRNIAGNDLMKRVFIASDFFGAIIDKGLAKKTGVRTTGMFDFKSVKAMKKGAFETMDDFRRHINTRNEELNRFDISIKAGKSFNEDGKGLFGTGVMKKQFDDMAKVMNALDRFTSFCLEMGDRPFYEMWYINSLNNQIKLNGVSEATPEMMAIACTEALQRTWQDKNALVKAISGVKKSLNVVNVGGYGLGDVMIKFTKTPANLTKAIFDFSPVGLVKALAVDARNFKKALDKGNCDAATQKRFVDSLSKGMAGTLVTLMAVALYATGRISGGGDEDDDVKNFEKHIQGVPEYSFRLFGKWWSYEWMQPIGATLASVADFMEGRKEKTDNKWYNDVIDAIRSGGETLYNQSFMQNIQQVFTAEGVVDGILGLVLGEPSVYIPQAISQFANTTDNYNRVTYEKNKPFKTSLNKVKVKIPGLRNTLEKRVDVLGRDIKNTENIFKRGLNSFINPANTFTNTSNEVTNEIYSLYKSTDNKAVMPRTAPNSFSVKGIKKILSANEKQDFQRIQGRITSEILETALKYDGYKKLSNEKKADFVKKVYDYAVKYAKMQFVEDNYEMLAAMVGEDRNNRLILTEEKYNKLTENSKNKIIEEYFLTANEMQRMENTERLVSYYISMVK